MRGTTKPLIVVALVFILCSNVLPASAAQISVEPPFQTVSSGENFTIDIYVDPEGNETAGVDFILRFNSTLLNATSLSSGTFFSGFDTYTLGEGINNTAGTIDYGELIWPNPDGAGVTTPGTIACITFQAIAEEDVVSELCFEKVTLSDPEGYRISTNISNGNVSVRAGVCGDVDGDEKITMFDGRQIWMNLIYGETAYPIANPWAADVDCDEKITMFDGRQIWMNLIYGETAYPLDCCQT